MKENYRKRFIESILPSKNKKILVLIEGARQIGKTTTAKIVYPELSYINLDVSEIANQIQNISTQQWSISIGNAVIDEAQKLPEIFNKIKYAFDEKQITFSVLLGSSQILLLKKIRESLAGGIAIYKLFPLMLNEIYSNTEILNPPLLNDILSGKNISEVLLSTPSLILDESTAKKKTAQEYLLTWGGMPVLLSIADDERLKWLRDYEYTYLERDLADLARISDLQPFRVLQKLAALRSAQLLNYSELARDAGISVDTARRYLQYLDISYQVFFLQPYFYNTTRSLVKTPKLYWIDLGILRQLTGQLKETTGQLFETMVVSEIYKWVKTMQVNAELFFYRTKGGLEIDLLIKMPQGILGIEIKSSKVIAPKDFRSLKTFALEHSGEWLGGIVMYNGDMIKKIADPDIWAIPSWRLFT